MARAGDKPDLEGTASRRDFFAILTVSRE